MSRANAIALKEELMDLGISAESILNYLLSDHMSGMEAYYAMEDAMEEFFPVQDTQYSIHQHKDPNSKNDCELFQVMVDGVLVYERDYGSQTSDIKEYIEDYEIFLSNN